MTMFKKMLLAAAVTLGAWTLLLAQSAGFHFRGPLSRVITPNGDHINDVAIFCVDNPGRSGVEGRIFTLLGTDVATLGPSADAAGTGCPPPFSGIGGEFLSWDGRSNGSVVHSGVYVYQIRAEGLTFTGSLVVVR
jgi:hypothetical protein